MGKASEHWQGFTVLVSDSDKYKRIQLLFSSANFEYLKEHGIDSRRRHQPDLPPHVTCSVDLTKFTSGFNNVVVELAFSDNVHWIARIPYKALDDGDKTAMLSEIATIKIIQQETTIPVPQIFDFETSAAQPFGYPYILMEYLGGCSLSNGLAFAIPAQYHAKVAKQLANALTELQNLTFSRIGRLWCGERADQPVEIIPMAWHSSPGPLETSFEYFYDQKQSENREAIDMHPDDPDWLTACWMLKMALTHIIIEDRVRGPFPLCHLDLHYGNMLFDDEYNLTGIIDCSSAQAAPLEQLSVSPEFVTFPGLSAEENRPILELKSLVVDFVREMEKSKGGDRHWILQRWRLHCS